MKLLLYVKRRRNKPITIDHFLLNLTKAYCLNNGISKTRDCKLIIMKLNINIKQPSSADGLADCYRFDTNSNKVISPSSLQIQGSIWMDCDSVGDRFQPTY